MLLLVVDLAVVGGQVIALHEHGAVRRYGDVPADIAHARAHLRGALAQPDSLVVVRDAEPDEAVPGIGVRVEILTGFVGERRPADHAVRTDQGGKAAARRVVNARAAAARAQKGVKRVRFALFVRQGDDADRVDRARVHGAHLLVLREPLLHEVEPAADTVIVKRACARRVFGRAGVEALDLQTAKAAGRFQKDDGMAVQKGVERLVVGMVQVEVFAPEKLRKRIAEPDLVLKDLGVLWGVHKPAQPPVVAHGEKGPAVAVPADVHEAENMVIEKADIVQDDAQEHVEHDQKGWCSGFFFHFAHIDEHAAKAEAADSSQQQT